jgi:hypothetical protein
MPPVLISLVRRFASKPRLSQRGLLASEPRGRVLIVLPTRLSSALHTGLLRGWAVMKRQKTPHEELLDLLLAQVAVHIREVNLLRQQIKIRPSSGEPNWDVSSGRHSGSVADAFAKARKAVQARYDVEWR